jgi:hypothetical protein
MRFLNLCENRVAFRVFDSDLKYVMFGGQEAVLERVIIGYVLKELDMLSR